MITSLFSKYHDFSAMTSLIFIQNFGNYSFVSIYWTVYCLRIRYHLFESYRIVLSKHRKNIALLPFIFCWLKHISLIIIQIFNETQFSSKFWTTDFLNIVDSSFFSFSRDLYTDNLFMANNYTRNINLDLMGLNNATWHIFLKIDEKLLALAKK